MEDNSYAVYYNHPAGCCQITFPTMEQFSLARLFLQGDKLLIAYTLAMTLKKCCGIESNQITCVWFIIPAN